jgi:signal transduction histidine kinase
MISLPLTVRQEVIGSLVLVRGEVTDKTDPSPDEFRLMVGIAQQLGLSIENARLYQEAQEREKMLANLLHQAVGAQEAERQRIARDLHDATGQSLTAIALGLRGTEMMLDSDPSVTAEQIRALRTFTTDALGELRRLISDLRPSQLDDLGLIAALKWYVGEFDERYPIKTDLVVEGDRVRLPAEYETVLFRITQEALTNIAKHANASHATIKLGIHPTQVSLTVCDDGYGFDVEKTMRGASSRTGWGLIGIQERASLIGGKHEIESAPGRGTVIRVEVPLVAETKDAKDTSIVG